MEQESESKHKEDDNCEMQEQHEILICAEKCEEENKLEVEEIAAQNSAETEVTITNDSSLYLASSEGDNDSDDSDRSECKMCEVDANMQNENEQEAISIHSMAHREAQLNSKEETEKDVVSIEKIFTTSAQAFQKSHQEDIIEEITNQADELKSVISSLPLFDNVTSKVAQPIAVSSQSAQSSPGMTEDERAEMSSSSVCHSGLFQYNDSISYQRRSESLASCCSSNNNSNDKSDRYRHRHGRYFEREQPLCYPEYGCCVFFFPSPVLSWLFPLAGHVGITNAEGSMLYTFESPYFVREERLSDVLDEIILQETEEHKKEHTNEEHQVQEEELEKEESQEHSQHECKQVRKRTNVLKIEEKKVQEPIQTSSLSSVMNTVRNEKRRNRPRAEFVSKKGKDDDYSNNDDHLHNEGNTSTTEEWELEEQEVSEASNSVINSEEKLSFDASTATKNTSRSSAEFVPCTMEEESKTQSEIKHETHPSYVLASASSPVLEVIADACKLDSSLSAEQYANDLESKETSSTAIMITESSPSEESCSSSWSSPLLSGQQKSLLHPLTGLKSKLLHFIWPFGWKSQDKAKSQNAEHAMHKSYNKKKITKHFGHSHCRCVSVWDLKSLLMQSNTSKSFAHHSHFGTAVWVRLQELLQGLEGHDDVFHLRRHNSDIDNLSRECSNDRNTSVSHRKTRTHNIRQDKKRNKEGNNTLNLDDYTAHLYNRNLQASIKLFRASADGANDTPELLIHQHYSFSLVAFVLEACGVGQRRQRNTNVKSCITNHSVNTMENVYKESNIVNDDDDDYGCKSKESSNSVEYNHDAENKHADIVVSTAEGNTVSETNHSTNNVNMASSPDAKPTGSLTSEVDEDIYWGVPKLLYYIWRYGKWHRTGYWPRRWMHGGNCIIAAALWLILIAVCTQYVYMWYLIWHNPVEETAVMTTTALTSEPVAFTASSSLPSTSSSPLPTESAPIE